MDRDEICGDGKDNTCTSSGDDCDKDDCSASTCPFACEAQQRASLLGFDPIHVRTRAALTEPFVDFAVEGSEAMAITRTYSSADVSVRSGGWGGAFGKGWHHEWEAIVTCDTPSACRVVRGLSAIMQFRRTGEALGVGPLDGERLNVYRRADSEALTMGDRSILVRRPSGEFILYGTDGSERHFTPDCAQDHCSSHDNFCTDAWQGGRVHLSRVVDARGRSIRVRYDRPSGTLLSLEDDVGHRLELKRNGSACDPSTSRAERLVYDGVSYVEYEYSATQLMVVRRSSPRRNGGILRSYEYGRVGYLTRIRNESGDPIVEFGYDDRGYATSLVDRQSSLTVSYPDRTSFTGASAGGGAFAGGTSSGSDSSSGGGSGGGTPAFDRLSFGGYDGVFSRRGRALQCMQDFEGRVHWFDRDDFARVVHHAMYAKGAYSCSSFSPPGGALVPLLEEWFEYGLRKEVAAGVHVELNAKTVSTRRSLLGTHLYSDPNGAAFLATHRSDHDPASKPGDPPGYECTVGGSSVALVPCREIDRGYTLDASGSPIEEEHTTFLSYDTRGRLLKRIGPITTLGSVPPGTLDPVQEQSYWPDDSELPRRGRLREIRRYSSPSRPPLVTTFDYDAFGPYQVVDPNGRVTLLVKDAHGRITAVAMPDGRSFSVRYYDGHEPRTIVSGSGAARRLSYDQRGRLSLIEFLSSDPEAGTATTPDGSPPAMVASSESRTYDVEGNAVLVERRDAQGVVRWRQVREYDSERRLAKQRHPQATERLLSIVYDATGNPFQVVDEEGRTTTLTLDDMGRPTTAHRSGLTVGGDPIGLNVGMYAYEGESGLLRSVTDAAGLTTSYQYDDFDRLLTVASPDVFRRGPARYSYDARANVVSRIFGATSVTYRYDALDRLTALEAVSSSGAPAVSYLFHYDENPGGLGRLTSVTESGRSTAYAYDEVGRLLTEAVTIGTSSRLVTEYRYDTDGNVAEVVYPSGLVVRYDRDPATGLPIAVRNPTTGTAFATGISYWPGGPVRELTFGNGLSLSQTFNLRYEPLSITTGPLSLGYTPTLAGNIAAISSGEGIEKYGYDFLDRLVSRRSTTGVQAAPLTVSYAGSRMVQAIDEATGAPAFAYGYDEQSNVTAVSAYDSTGATVSSTVCLVHDALGRMVLAGYARPGIGGPGALTCQSEDDVQEVVARFRYDFANRRVARQDASGQLTHFTFLGGQPLAEMTATGPAWTPAREYVWLDSSPLVQIEHRGATASSTYHFHSDHLGMPRALTNESGQTVWRATPLPYGEVAESSGTDPLSGHEVVTNLRLPGQYDERLLGSLGLQGPYYNWNRWYLPGVGRYLEPDPIAMAGGFNGEFGPDWYGYANANPLRYSDATGSIAVADDLAIAGLAALGVLAYWATRNYLEQCTATRTCPWHWRRTPPANGPRWPPPANEPMPPPRDGSPSPAPPTGYDPKRKDNCDKEYAEAARRCADWHTSCDDTQYDACMDRAWSNYRRCLSGLPWRQGG
jgi:RHS repeat-associated protein